MQCWHGCVIEQKRFLTDKTNLPAHPLQFNHTIFNSIRRPDLGLKDLWNIAVTMHSPFPLFPTIVTYWRKRVTTIQLWLNESFFFFFNYDLIILKKKSSKALVLKLYRSKKLVKHNLKIKFNFAKMNGKAEALENLNIQPSWISKAYMMKLILYLLLRSMFNWICHC